MTHSSNSAGRGPVGPARNRVSPRGDIVATTTRGAWMGNRGRLHEGDGSRDIVREHQNMSWLTCALTFKDRKLSQWQPGHYTLLFFLDEAVAFAAGHRPCAECRRADYNSYRAAWRRSHGEGTLRAKDIDEQLHRERRPDGPSSRPSFEAEWANLPDGTFVMLAQGPAVVVGEHLSAWDNAGGYGTQLPRPRTGCAQVITPRSNVDVLRAGYPIQIDDSAR